MVCYKSRTESSEEISEFIITKTFGKAISMHNKIVLLKANGESFDTNFDFDRKGNFKYFQIYLLWEHVICYEEVFLDIVYPARKDMQGQKLSPNCISIQYIVTII